MQSKEESDGFQEIHLKDCQDTQTIISNSLDSNNRLSHSREIQSTYIGEGISILSNNPISFSQVPEDPSSPESSYQPAKSLNAIQETNQAQENSFLINLAKYAKYCALANIIIDILLAMALPYLIVVLLFNILGYIGAKNLSKFLCIGYCFYIGITVIGRIFLMIYFPYIYLVVVFSVLSIFQVSLFILFFGLSKMILEKDSEEIKKILEALNDRKRLTKCCGYII